MPDDSILPPLALFIPADDSQPLPYNRRLLDASSVMAPEASAAAAMWRPELEAWVQQLVAANSLRPLQAQQQAVEVLVADARALAHEVITSTRSNLDALSAQLVASMPADTSASAMATLLHTTDFNALLKEAVDDAVVLVTGAMYPHLSVVAQTAHAALASCLQQPDALDPLPIFADSFLPHFVEKFPVNVVEATLLHSLWRDA
ncbi:hypothetical protein D9Q98_008937 [Chlorella vulgaris]|uniref:Uncharacterized protein n=1 Tax=Chlorella vulgaris TaxID=3077 RepID=A0A9D4YT63_CHLVU|nr:hypothetical protein D9Q98_008937 [Chlorella vulgaris]